MLVQFSVRNFKTFKDEVKLTLFASNYDKQWFMKNYAAIST